MNAEVCEILIITIKSITWLLIQTVEAGDHKAIIASKMVSENSKNLQILFGA